MYLIKPLSYLVFFSLFIPTVTDKMRIGSMNDDKMTCTMLGAWLTELYLNERSEQLISPHGGSASHDADASQRVRLAQFLNANVNNMDARTIMKILTSHDVGASECASYASKSGDVAAAVNAALNTGPRDPVRLFANFSLSFIFISISHISSCIYFPLLARRIRSTSSFE